MDYQNWILGLGIPLALGLIFFVSRNLCTRASNFVHRVNRTFDNVDRLVYEMRRRQEIDGVLLEVNRAIIDALEKGKANGNVEKAKNRIDTYLRDVAVGGSYGSTD